MGCHHQSNNLLLNNGLTLKTMKKIFVTVAEFLENGGELTDGRKIYDSRKTFYNGTYLRTDGDSLILNRDWYTNARETKELTEFCYIEIDCTPIYK